jgi:hypothetical protein
MVSRCGHGARTRAQRRPGLWLALLLIGASPGCGDDPAQSTEGRTFTVEVSGEQFRVRVAGASNIAAFEARRESGVTGVINGELRAGDGGFNAPWSWHLDPETVHAPDITIELCDGRPSLVEADTAYWIRTVGRFCPWGARVVAAN